MYVPSCLYVDAEVSGRAVSGRVDCAVHGLYAPVFGREVDADRLIDVAEDCGRVAIVVVDIKLWSQVIALVVPS